MRRVFSTYLTGEVLLHTFVLALARRVAYQLIGQLGVCIWHTHLYRCKGDAYVSDGWPVTCYNLQNNNISTRY